MTNKKIDNLIDITEDQILLNQLNLIDQKNKTLKEFNTHYDPKIVYKNAKAYQSMKSKKKKELDPFGSKQEQYKYKNH